VKLTLKVVLETPEPHVKTPLASPQAPLLDFKVKVEEETGVAVYVAHVPPTNHLPVLIKQPPLATLR